MPYCYACRNSKPATHRHFVEYGALALYPPKRHITAIQEEWAQLSEEEQRQELQEARELLTQEAGSLDRQERPANVSRAAHRSPAIEAPQEGERMGLAGWIAAGLLGGVLALGGIFLWNNPGLAGALVASIGEYGAAPGE